MYALQILICLSSIFMYHISGKGGSPCPVLKIWCSLVKKNSSHWKHLAIGEGLVGTSGPLPATARSWPPKDSKAVPTFLIGPLVSSVEKSSFQAKVLVLRQYRLLW